MRCPKCHTDNPDTSRFCGGCASPLGDDGGPEFSVTQTLERPVQAASPGTIVAGKYRILEEIGRGGMGVVYRAEDVKLDRPVALKFLPPQWTSDKEARERFTLEARAASTLDHPNICNIHEIGETEDRRMFIAMACYEGESLREKLRRGPLKPDEAIGLAVQVAQGMLKAHQKGIVHRDIKPANILITNDGVAKILDFGLAKLTADIGLTRTGATLGTLAYMSPEQAGGKPVDPRTDIWSLGVVLYEMLTGQLPFSGENEASLIHAILERPARPPRKADAAIPADIERVVLRALEKVPADRYRTMADFLSDLEALAEGLKPTKAKARFLRGRILGIRKPVFYAGLVALAAAAAFLVFAVLIPPAQAEVFDSIAILPIVNESGDPAKDYIANSMTSLITSRLHKVTALRVAPQETVLQYKDSKLTPAEIASALGVKALVRASVFPAGEKIRLTATLSDPFKIRILWTDTLEEEEEDTLALQSRLCQAIVQGIKVAVTPDETSRLTAASKVDPVAFDLFMQGIDFGNRDWSDPNTALRDYYSKWLDYFQRAIDIDPSFALAHAWKGLALLGPAYNQYENPQSALKKAKEAALKAIELDDDLAEAHGVLANVRLYLDWDFNGAEMENKKALETSPGNDSFFASYEQLLACIGRYDESIARFKARMRKDKKLRELVGAGSLVDLYASAGRYDEALEEQINAFKNDQGQISALWLAVIYSLKGMHPEALSLLEELIRQPIGRDEPFVVANYARVLALSGRRDDALSELARLNGLLVQKYTPSAWFAAAVYAALGDKDRAFEFLNQCYESRWPYFVWIRSSAWFHSLHGDPRFEELIRKMGFPET